MSPQRLITLWAVVLLSLPNYVLAKAHFLPNYSDHLAAYSSSVKLDFSNKNDAYCTGYSLATCPDHARCQRCFEKDLFRITSCQDGYTQSATSCTAKSCDKIKSSYVASVADGKVCNKKLTTDILCFIDCRSVACSSYPVSKTCPTNAYCDQCPDCLDTETYKGACSVPLFRVAACRDPVTKKVNANASACIDKDDTCSSGYAKACDTGIDGNYSTKYTELGTACYKCRARTCSSGGLNIDYYWCKSFLKCVLK